MPFEVWELGLERYALLTIALLWGLGLVGWVALQLGRVRLPSILFWLAPSAMLISGAIGAWVALQSSADVLQTSGLTGNARDMAAYEALRVSLSPIVVALYTTALGLAVSAPCVALANIIRGGPNARLTPLHAAACIPVVAMASLGLLAGLDVFILAVVCSLSIGLASLRIGTGADGRRMAAGRGLVASMGVASALCLTLAYPLRFRLRQLQIWSSASFEDQPRLLAELGDPVAAISANLGVAGVMVVGGAMALLPVVNRVVNARSSAGFVGSLLLITPLSATVLVPLQPLGKVKQPNPARDRALVLEKTGIILPLGIRTAPWTAGTHVTVGTYWATVGDRRVLPYKEGRAAPDDNWEGLDNALRAGIDQPLVVEADYRADLPRIAPILEHAYALGYPSVCFVVQNDKGAMSCQTAKLGEPADADAHLLVETTDLVIVTDAAPGPITLDELASLTPPVALHLHDGLMADRLHEVLGAGVPDPILMINP